MNSTTGISPGKAVFNVILLVFLGIAFFFLITEHQAHFFGALPYLLLLACPFMHMFMHRGHKGHHHDQQHDTSRGEMENAPLDNKEENAGHEHHHD